MAKLLSNTRIYGTATIDTRLFVNGNISSHSTNTGVLQLIGGIGVAGSGFFSGVVTATSFIGAFNGTASLATDVAGGTAGQLLYQIAPNDTGFVGPGTAGQILTSGGTSIPVYVNTGSIYVGRAVLADSATSTTGNAATVSTQQRTTNAGHFLLFVDSNNVAATEENLYTTSSFQINPATGGITVANSITFNNIGVITALNLGNNNIVGVNNIAFSDPGAGEGLEWAGGNGWKIYESPDTLTNAGGNLQFVTVSTRRATIRTDGTVDVTGGGLFGGTVTATNFVGAFTGGSTQVETRQATAASAHFLTFVDSNNASATAETVYTTSSFVINPSTGFIGLGTTTPTDAKIHLSGTGSYAATIRMQSLGTSGADAFILATDSSWTAGANLLAFGIGGSPASTRIRMVINSSGSVGIGTTAPGRPLHVAGTTADTRIRVSADDGTNYRGYEITAGTTFKGGMFYRTTEGNVLQIWGTNGSLGAIYIDSNNVVDINSSASVHSTATGALQVIGGLGVGGGGFFGGIVTATNFVGNLTGGVSQVNTQQRTTNASHFLTFVDSDNGSATAENLYTVSTVILNPSNAQVGINSSLPAATITSKLYLGGDFTLVGSTRSFLGNLYYDTSWKYAANGYGWGFREDGAGKVQFLRAANNTSGAGAAATVTLPDLMTWDLVNNRIGVGTASPAYKFDVNGEIGLSGQNLYFDGANINLRGNTVFNFLTDAGGAQSAKFKSIQVSTSYSGSLPDNGILFSTDSNLYRSAALTLRSNSNLIIDQTLDVTGISRFRSGYIGGDTQGYPSFDFLLDFGSDVANTWRKLVTISSPTGLYVTIGFKIEITDPRANHATISSANQIIKETYYVACVRTNDVTQDTPDACYVYGPSNRIRAIKTAVGAYEIHIQNEAQFREYRGSISVYAVNGGHTVTYSNGTTIGTATATYAATNSTNGQERISGGLYVSGNVGIATTSPGFNLDVTGTARATSDFRAPIFYDTNDTAYYTDPASTSVINNMTFAGTISSSNASTRTKYRVYGSGSYAIGMQSGVTFGGLNDWAMTFQFNNDDDRGFWWGDDAHSVGQGAMALNTRGWLTVAERIKVGGGQSDTADPSGDALQVVGTGSATVDFRAPIFYDSNNTAYYLDPGASTTSAVIAGNIAKWTDAGTKYYTHLCTGSFYQGTGAVVITTNIPGHNQANNANMFSFKVIGYWYDSTNGGVIDMTFGCYAGENNFYNVSYTGTVPNAWLNNVTVYTNASGKVALVLGTVSTSQACEIAVTDFVQGFVNVNVPYSQGWTASLVTSLTGYVNGVAALYRTTARYIQGSVGINTSSPAEALHVTGNTVVTGEITAYYSDARLKNVKGRIENALDKIDKLGGYYYTSNEEAGRYGFDTEKTQVGVLAQEVETVLPEIVTHAPFDIEQDDQGKEHSKSGFDYKTVKYEKLIPLLIEAIKELKSEIASLKGKK